MNILFASNNAHKVHELRLCFPEHTIEIPRDHGLTFEHDETADTFYGNAVGKAQALRTLIESSPKHGYLHQTPIIADDSGISALALQGAPGIYSARFGASEGLVLDDRGRTALLLNKMEGESDRRVYYTCAMVVLWSMTRFSVVQETMEGILLDHREEGSTGFGYDPVVFIPSKQCSVSQLSEAEKTSISHRGKAARQIAKLLPILQGET